MDHFTNNLLPTYMKRLSHFLSQFISKKAEPYGITNAQLNIMFCLMGGESVTQKQLLKYLDVKSSSLTVLLEQLERKGLIDRKLHPDDSRAKILILSEKGKNFIQQIVVPMGAEMEKELLKGFSQDEKDQLFNFLDRLLSNFERIKSDKDETI